MKKKIRVFIIGLDGMHWDFIYKFLLPKGLAPNLSNLLQNSVKGILKTPFPPLTPVAWSSFQTGLKPERHGVYDFFFREKNSYMAFPYDRTMMRGISMWKYLSKFGVSVGCINMPMTYPPERVNGYIISGTLTPVGSSVFSYPPSLSKEIINKFGKYLIHHTIVYEKGRIMKLIKQQEEILYNRTEVSIYMMEKYPVDVMMVHFLGTDRIQHELWHVLDISHPQHDKSEERYFPSIYRYFKLLDASIGKLLSNLPPYTYILLVSDHGFGPVYKYFHINTFLHKRGYLKFKKDVISIWKKFLFDIGLTPGNIYKLMSIVGISKLRRSTDILTRYKFLRRFFLSFNNVDWKNTKAYSIGNFGQIYINLKGREPLGGVEPDEYDEVVESIIKDLKRLKDEKGNVIQEVMKGEEYYRSTDYRRPDIIYLTRNMEIYPLGTADFSSSEILEEIYGHTGNHRLEGIFALSGKGVRKNDKKFFELNIYDIFPLISYLVRVPIPKGIDGKLNLALFDRDFLKNNPPHFTDIPSVEEDEEKGLTKEEKLRVKKHLEDLGYLG